MTRRTLLKSAFAVTATTMAPAVAAPAAAQERTVYEPSASDPRIVAALDAQRRLGVAMIGRDFKAVEMMFANDLVVHSPVNLVVNRDNVLARLRSGQISYEPDYVRKVDFAGVRGDTVVIMGEEIVDPIANTPNAGKTVRRRFTDIWKNVDGVWKLAIRQATVTSVQ
ncbi:MAG TPA: nuclear transport factor 2 family protein [Vicinamibacterales bacterium]|nr:nuclear transport factor 2 family protein [Vicinamibacterales bacterium]